MKGVLGCYRLICAVDTVPGYSLKRIEGQVRGIQRMVDENRYCMDVLTQISAINESLRKVSEALLRDHLDHCVTNAIDSGDRREKERIYDELADLFNKYARSQQVLGPRASGLGRGRSRLRDDDLGSGRGGNFRVQR